MAIPYLGGMALPGTYIRPTCDALIVGSGPNGLAAAITMQRLGLRTLVLEAADTPGGGLRSAACTLPGFLHDLCAAVHPLALASPFFRALDLESFGLQFCFPQVEAAHPFEGGRAVCLYRSLRETARQLGEDEAAYQALINPLLSHWPDLSGDVLGPLRLTARWRALARFGWTGLRSARHVARRFRTEEAAGFWAGMAAHSILPLEKPLSAAVAQVLLLSGHHGGWPIVRGGTQALAAALVQYYRQLGGMIETGIRVQSMNELPPAKVILFDLSPRQLLRIAGDLFTPGYRRQLRRYRHGPGVFKLDWALDGPIPWRNAECRKAGTLHLGGPFKEIAAYERSVWVGLPGDRPFVLLTQPTILDPTRCPPGKHTAWAYCHVPAGWEGDMTDAIETQVERFAPGFRDLVLARHHMRPAELEAYNPNYVGGDINGGILDLRQLVARPVLRRSPYRSSATGIYICSSSTPPGGGVHGMCGYHAARRALRDVFHMNPDKSPNDHGNHSR